MKLMILRHRITKQYPEIEKYDLQNPWIRLIIVVSWRDPDNFNQNNTAQHNEQTKSIKIQQNPTKSNKSNKIKENPTKSV